LFTEQDIENIEPEEPVFVELAEPEPAFAESAVVVGPAVTAAHNLPPYVSPALDRITSLPPSYRTFRQPTYVLEPTSLPINEQIGKAEDLSYR
jgi:hypothetical protein